MNSNEKKIIARSFEIWESQEKAFEKTRHDHPELYKTMGSEVNQRLEELKSMKKAELLQRASELEKEVWWLTSKYQSVSVWSINKIIMELVRKRFIHSQGAVTTKQRKDDFWAAWKERFYELRAAGYSVTDARRNIQQEIYDYLPEGKKKRYRVDGALKRHLKDKKT